MGIFSSVYQSEEIDYSNYILSVSTTSSEYLRANLSNLSLAEDK